MWRKKKEMPDLELDKKEQASSGEMVRRIEVSVEREVCSLTVHGQLILTDQNSCPLCGQSLMAGEPDSTGSSNELPRGSTNDEGKLK